jgi:hypothetical protein
MIAAKARDYYDAEAKKRQEAAGREHGRGKPGKVPETLPEAIKGDTRDQVGKTVGVSGRTVDKAIGKKIFMPLEAPSGLYRPRSAGPVPRQGQGRDIPRRPGIGLFPAPRTVGPIVSDRTKPYGIV